MDITFSSDIGYSRKDLDETSKLAEEYFGTKKDKNQIPTTKETRDWVFKNIQDYVNLIKHNGKIIGFSFAIPTNKKIMNMFLNSKITERELFEKVKTSEIQDIPEAIYLCSAVIKKEYQQKGLAITAFTKTIGNILSSSKEKPVLFYEPYSIEGDKLAKKIAITTHLKLLKKE